jgi:hypothetical protein
VATRMVGSRVYFLPYARTVARVHGSGDFGMTATYFLSLTACLNQQLLGSDDGLKQI